MYVCVCVHVCMCVYVCMYVCVHACMCVCMHVSRMYVFKHRNVYAYSKYIHTYVNTCMKTYMYTGSLIMCVCVSILCLCLCHTFFLYPFSRLHTYIHTYICTLTDCKICHLNAGISSLWWRLPYIHTYINIHTYLHKCAYIHTNIHTYICTLTDCKICHLNAGI